MSEDNILSDSFNARYLSFKEIAESFIPNEQYTELIKNNHSLLMGPRGSGKTTLLKMLTPAALSYWDLKTSNDLINKIAFFGIYIPTDIQWKRQLEQFEKEFTGNDNYIDLISRLVVTTNILISTIKTFSSILEFNLNKELGALQFEADISKEIVDSWKLPKPISPNLFSIELNLRNRLIEINNHIKRAKYSGFKNLAFPDYFYDEYFRLITTACTIFENKFKDHAYFKDRPFRWALCFDELEIAPNWLQFELLDQLRSRDQRFIFKLTTAPIISLYDQIKRKLHIPEALPQEDYKIIRTWTYNKINTQEWIKFSTLLISSKFERKFSKSINPLHVFGNSNLERVISTTLSKNQKVSETKGYTRGSASWLLLKELAIIDPGFKKYIMDKDIDPSDPVPNSPSQADQVHRKLKPLAIYRYQYKKKSGLRSRKNVPIYYGLPFIYEMCDGNPRALIGVFDEFISNAKFTDDGQLKEFDINQQSRIIREMANRYLNVLSTHPDSNQSVNAKNVNLGDLLRKIGKYFHNRIVHDKFSIDPAGAFTIDKNIDPKILELMELAVYLGAIIYLNPYEATTPNGIAGKLFRVSYLLTPAFDIPSIEFRGIDLSTILSEVEISTSKQILLFSENENKEHNSD